MIRHSIKALLILLIIVGMVIFLSPYSVFAQTPTPIDAVDDTIFIPQNTVDVTIDVLANDLGDDINLASLAIATPPLKGVAVIDSGNIKYTPTNTTLIGSDTLQYKICETTNSSTCDTATVAIYVAKPVAVDIKPGSCPNPFNLKSRGVLPVAILGTPAFDSTPSFDVTLIDRGTLSLEWVGPIRTSIEVAGVAPTRTSTEDVATPFTGEITSCENCTELGPDGNMDLTLKFSTQAIVQAIGVDNVNDGDCLVLTLTGKLEDDTPIIGEDVLRILKKGKVKPPKPPNPHKPIKN